VIPALRRAFGSWSRAERRELAARVADLPEGPERPGDGTAGQSGRSEAEGGPEGRTEADGPEAAAPEDEDFDFAHPVLHGRRDGEQFAQTGQKQSGRVLQRGEPRAGRRRAVPRPFDAGVQIEHRRADASGLLAVIDQVVNHGLQA